MSLTPREIGTLIVVVLKANHLPNKRHIGKQDPYCLVSVNGEKRRTKAIKRGGQHPEWDEEIRFTLYEDVGDILDRTAHGDGTPPPPPPKDDKGPKKIKGGKIMKLSCFADDPREPDLIGEADVDLTEVLTKGETDEWFTLMNKDKFSGKVYLELTFWSNEPPPEKKITPKPAKNKQYGGPGSFVPSGDLPSSLTNGAHPSRIVSTSSLYDHSRQNSDNIPSSLRASSSLAKLDLYVPPYEQNRSSIDKFTNEFGEFSISESHRRESLPSPHGGYTPRPPSPTGYSTFSSHPSHGYDRNIPEAASGYPLEYTAAQPSVHQRSSVPGVHPPQSQYQSQYETGLPSAYHQLPTRGSRQSIPTSSSGFVPLQNTSGFVPHSSHPPDPALYGPSLSSTSAPINYNSSQFNSQTYPPVTMNTDPYFSSSASIHSQLSFPPPQSFQYPQYPLSTTPIPSQQYTTALPPVQPLTQPTATQVYTGYAVTSSPSHDSNPAPLVPQNSSLSSSFGTGSRPLPQQPQVAYGQPQVQLPYSMPPGGSQVQYNSTQSGGSTFTTGNTYQAVPPPPPPPPVQYNPGQPYVSSTQQAVTGPPPPPPPPPPQTVSGSSARRHSSLPQPPVNLNYQHQPAYQQPPPPPPSEFFTHNQPPPPPPPTHVTNHHPGPLPTPPSQRDTQGQWVSPPGYSQHSYS